MSNTIQTPVQKNTNAIPAPEIEFLLQEPPPVPPKDELNTPEGSVEQERDGTSTEGEDVGETEGSVPVEEQKKAVEEYKDRSPRTDREI